MLEALKTVSFFLLVAPVTIVGAFCAIAAMASKIEDRATDEPTSRTLADRASDACEYLRDLPRAA